MLLCKKSLCGTLKTHYVFLIKHINGKLVPLMLFSQNNINGYSSAFTLMVFCMCFHHFPFKNTRMFFWKIFLWGEGWGEEGGGEGLFECVHPKEFLAGESCAISCIFMTWKVSVKSRCLLHFLPEYLSTQLKDYLPTLIFSPNGVVALWVLPVDLKWLRENMCIVS